MTNNLTREAPRHHRPNILPALLIALAITAGTTMVYVSGALVNNKTTRDELATCRANLRRASSPPITSTGTIANSISAIGLISTGYDYGSRFTNGTLYTSSTTEDCVFAAGQHYCVRK